MLFCFLSYGLITSNLQQAHPDRPLQPHEIFGAAFTAGTAQVVLSNPLSVVKTRMLMNPKPKRLSLIDTARAIVKSEGKKILFTKGLCPSLISVVHGSIQITIYEWIRQKVTNNGENQPVINEHHFSIILEIVTKSSFSFRLFSRRSPSLPCRRSPPLS